MRANILFIDNHVDFLETRKLLLEKSGYTVFTVTNPNEANNYLKTHMIDLAIIDVRLEDENDERDVSGLRLAGEIDPSIPKIILTQYPALAGVREALKRLPGGPIAEDYLAKRDGYETFLNAVEQALLRKVFISHGHDEMAKKDVVRFVETLNFRPVVLSDLNQKNGRTTIELLEAYSNVGYAVIVLSPDDVGGIQGTTEELQPRARQNVIFELGYFLAKLGRQNVFALLKGGVEIPSNYQGVFCINMDSSGDWKEKLKAEIIS